MSNQFTYNPITLSANAEVRPLGQISVLLVVLLVSILPIIILIINSIDIIIMLSIPGILSGLILILIN